MIIGIPKEIYPGERRVAMVPASIPALKKAGCEVLIESGAGVAAGFPDGGYTEKGASLAPSGAEVFQRADVVLRVLWHGANDRTGREDLPLIRKDQVLIGFVRPLGSPDTVKEITATGATIFAVELIPRITRAQGMDAMSAMATIAGYKAAILAADSLPRFFPMLTTAAGTITPARVLVMGAGVAGLQAISTVRRLGAVASGYDVRPAAREQILSVGGRAVDLGLETGQAEDKGGYAKAQDESFLRRQREAMKRVVAESDVAITTAVVPGKRAPILITAEMVEAMAPGSVIIDLAAERGGNCELTHPNETAVEHGVTILGPLNLAGTVPYHASLMMARTLSAFVLNIVKDGKLTLDMNDEITREALLAKGGEIANARVRELMAEESKGAGKASA
ncbi:MAG: NAD(P) transhydrogenase subunit alpha [Candidatus Binataceae bacterium]